MRKLLLHGFSYFRLPRSKKLQDRAEKHSAPLLQSQGASLSIGERVLVYFSLVIILITALIAVLWNMSNNAKLLAATHEKRYEARMIAEELHKSSDDLTRMARTHLATGDPRFKDYFYAILDIRNGLSPHPRYYDHHVFWDMVSANPDTLNKTDHEEPRSILNRIHGLGLPDLDFTRLEKGLEISEELVGLEEATFSLIEKDLRKQANAPPGLGVSQPLLAAGQTQGIKELFSPEYHRYKAAIMSEIHAFVQELDDRFIDMVHAHETRQAGWRNTALVIGLALLSLGVYGYRFYRINISIPVSRSHEKLKKLHPDWPERDTDSPHTNEIGTLIERFTRLLTHDYLTNLPNRHWFMQTIKEQNPASLKKAYVGLLIIDLDNFKTLNSTCGYQAGNALISQLATTLKIELPKDIILSRLDDDKFGLLGHFDTAESAENLGKHCLSIIKNYPFVWTHFKQRFTASIGVSVINAENFEAQNLFSEAGKACRKSTMDGGNRVTLSFDHNSQRQKKNLRLLKTLHQTLEESNFHLFAQPILGRDPNQLLPPKLEILLKQKDPSGKFFTPRALIEVAEQYHQISQLDYWVTKNTLRLLPLLSANGWQVSINTSPQTLLDKRFLHLLETEFERLMLPEDCLWLEIKERQIVVNMNQTRAAMHRLGRLGIRFALDDFGSGYASYGVIRQLPINILKIDQKIIQKLTIDPDIEPMLQSIGSMAKSLQINLVAVHVDNPKVLKQLARLGVEYLQGELISMPMPVTKYFSLSADDFETPFIPSHLTLTTHSQTSSP